MVAGGGYLCSCDSLATLAQLSTGAVALADEHILSISCVDVVVPPAIFAARHPATDLVAGIQQLLYAGVAI